MKTLVTGAYGNIGQFITKELLAEGREVVALDLPNPSTKKAAKRLRNPKVHAVWGNLLDASCVARALDGVQSVVHAAAIIPPLSEDNPDLATEVNVVATRRLIEQMEASATAKRIVFASSMGIYGKNQARTPPLHVEDPPSPDDHYGVTKVQAEAAVRASSLDWAILRIAACPPVNLSSARSHKGNNPFSFHPDARIEIVHPEDAGRAFARAAIRDAAVGKTFFIGGGASCQMRHIDLTRGVFRAAGLNEVPREAFNMTAPGEMYGDWLDTEDSQRVLEFQRHTPEDFFRDFRRSLGPLYHLTRLMAPVATWGLVKRDGYDNP